MSHIEDVIWASLPYALLHLLPYSFGGAKERHGVHIALKRGIEIAGERPAYGIWLGLIWIFQGTWLDALTERS